MMKGNYEISAPGLWVKSYVLAILVPSVLWFIIAWGLGSLGMALGCCLYSIILHTIGYIVVGIPLLCILERNNCTACWRTVPACALGGVVTFLVSLLMISVVVRGELPSLKYSAGFIIILTIHGAWTGFAVSRTRKKLEAIK